MTMPAVHWHEGMFLRPHHLQTSERHIRALGARNAKWNAHYNWGLRTIELDLDALANYRVVVRTLKARMHDGSLISVPEDGTLPVYDLRQAMQSDASAVVYLAVPLLQLARANANSNGRGDDARWRIDTQDLEDENTGLNPQPIQVRMLNVKLLFSTQDHSGYEVLPLARVKRADRAEAVPQLDESYIPPLLACDAWKPLVVGILEPLYDRLGKKVEMLSSQVLSRGITFDSFGQGDRLIFEQLRVLCEAYAPLGIEFFAQGVHPLRVYTELSRLVGQLAIFGAQRRPPELPKYDHDDLATCFWRVKQSLDALLDVVVEPDYRERSFIGSGLRMQVALESQWLEPGWQLFVGVQSSLAAEQCVHLLNRGLDMKIGSSDRVDETFRLGQAGMRFNYVSHPPRVLPSRPGLIYFQVDPTTQAEEWKQVERSLALAIRLNENLIVSNIQGQQSLAIKVGGQTTTLQFTLYVVPKEQADRS